MKILYLVPDLFGAPGGIARYCRLVTRALTETDDVQLDILALHDQRGVTPDTRYLRGGRWSYTPFDSSRAKFTRRAILAIARGGYDLLLSGHVNFTPLLHGIPLRPDRRITFIYGVDAWRRLPWHRRMFLQRATSVISISQHTAKLAARANRLATNRLHILHNCLDPSLDPARVTAPSTCDDMGAEVRPFADHAILTVARMWLSESSKGHDAVIRALPEVRQTIPDVQYYIVGEGDQRPSLEALAAALGVRDSVHFLGRLSDAMLQRCYRDCTLFAMPSSEEGFGFVFLEAMAHGRPVLAGNRDAGPEVIGHNEGGLLVDPDDTRQIARAIERVLTDSDLQRRLGQAGRARVARLFNYDHFKHTLMGHLSAAVGTSPDSVGAR